MAVLEIYALIRLLLTALCKEVIISGINGKEKQGKKDAQDMGKDGWVGDLRTDDVGTRSDAMFLIGHNYSGTRARTGIYRRQSDGQWHRWRRADCE